ncbi:TadE family protein [Virgibacillus ndiopensis]|uniref:TadE family protein n=1 Tax=Virgibacillus ndiopensis TaxID=2004408 RepID=UPI00159BE64A|nr:TadE family protein [Virgibacillus ndiopensis]
MNLRKEDGSITLEAAMVLPIFMLFVVFMASMIRISVAEIALNKSVAETAQFISTHAYPATIVTEGVNSIIDDKLTGMTLGTINLQEAEEFIGTSFREVMDINVTGSSFIQSFSDSKIKSVVQDKFADNVASNLFDESNVSVEVDLPVSLQGGEDSYIGISATYDLDLYVPFVSHTITIKKNAYERLWVGSF